MLGQDLKDPSDTALPPPRLGSGPEGDAGLAHRPRQPSDVRHLVVPVSIGVYSLYAAASVLTLRYERVFFALVIIAAAIGALGTDWRRLPSGASRLCGLWLGAIALYFVASLLQQAWAPTYVVGDLLLALLPLLMFLSHFGSESALTSRVPLIVLVSVMTIAAIEAKYLGTVNHRHDAPSPFLIAAAWYLTLAGRTHRAKMCGVALVVLAGYLTYSSGYRTHLLLWLLAPALVLLVLKGTRAVILTIACLTVISFSLSLSGHPFSVTKSLDDTRFDTVINSQTGDVSVGTRFSEMKDVFSTAADEWLPGEQAIGYGFGASYEPSSSDITRNIDSDGRVHNIHIGPALVYFRYGILGLVIMTALFGFSVRMLFRVRRRQYSKFDRDTFAILSLSLILFFLEFLTLNASVEPLMSYCVAGLLAIKYLGQSDAPLPEPSPATTTSGLWRR